MTRFLIKKNLINILNDHLIDYPTPAGISYFYGFGSLAGISLGIQIFTGMFLAMHYVPHVDYAFWSIEHIMRNVKYGWLLRYTHSNGASIFFILVYIHMGRGLYYGSYSPPRIFVWISGVVIFILMMAAAFMGYVLPWGQMSFWGATVITNLFSAIPIVGKSVAFWLWGGFSVDQALLNRFFSLHYVIPFVIGGVVFLHITLLHMAGSSTPLGSLHNNLDSLGFYPYFVVKDAFGIALLGLLYTFLVCFHPNLLGHSDNYIMANALVTPSHIVPEWYFLPFYAILRSIPDKLGGVTCMGLAIAIFFIYPLLMNNMNNIQSSSFKKMHSFLCFVFFVNFIFLGFIGSSPVEYPFVMLGRLSTILYFLLLIVILPLLSRYEIKFISKGN